MRMRTALKWPSNACSRQLPRRRIQYHPDRLGLPVTNRGMNQRFNLDVSSFQKLLEAAWVLQCERDRELSESRMIESPKGATVLALPSDKGERNAAPALPSPVNVFEPARAVADAHTPQVCEILDPSV